MSARTGMTCIICPNSLLTRRVSRSSYSSHLRCELAYSLIARRSYGYRSCSSRSHYCHGRANE